MKEEEEWNGEGGRKAARLPVLRTRGRVAAQAAQRQRRRAGVAGGTGVVQAGPKGRQW